MSDLIVYGFPRSTFVNIVRLVLTHKEVTYTFHDLEPEMGKPSHLALHPFNRVPILRHGDFTVYETSAIVSYLEESFPKPALQPKSVRDRARVNQWISAVNAYGARQRLPSRFRTHACGLLSPAKHLFI
jgi:glutathione S-transferase